MNFGVISLWRRRPNMDRTFKIPLYPMTPILGVIVCLYLITSLASITWLVFFAWLAVGHGHLLHLRLPHAPAWPAGRPTIGSRTPNHRW